MLLMGLIWLLWFDTIVSIPLAALKEFEVWEVHVAYHVYCVHRGQHGLSCVSCVFGAHTEDNVACRVYSGAHRWFCSVMCGFPFFAFCLFSSVISWVLILHHIPFCSACTSTWMLSATLSTRLVLGPELSAVRSLYIHFLGISICFLQCIDFSVCNFLSPQVPYSWFFLDISDMLKLPA